MVRFLFALIICTTAISCGSISGLPGSTTTSSVTQAEAAQGIRQALDQGVGKGISLLNRPDGFFGNQAYKLLMPPDAQRIEQTLRQLGMGSMVDKAILQINRAAEDAVG